MGSGGIGLQLQGISVALSADGNTALIGALGDNNDTGAVWVFTEIVTGTGVNKVASWLVPARLGQQIRAAPRPYPPTAIRH